MSFDGNLYFSSLENIDRGKYSCNVQSTVSSNGRNGPFFALEVRQHPNYQQLKFPNNFPKSFPEAPRVGEDVRLECVAFGYPVPSYNWTRKGAPLPKGVIITNYNRVLVLPKVKVEDMGDYVCRATNDKVMNMQNTLHGFMLTASLYYPSRYLSKELSLLVCRLHLSSPFHLVTCTWIEAKISCGLAKLLAFQTLVISGFETDR